MPIRATKRGAERTRLTQTDADVLICGASFAGLATARALAGARARVLVLDRYEIGERQTSACAAPTEWLENLGLQASIRQTFDRLVVHTPRGTSVWPLPWAFSTFDYRQLCADLFAHGGAGFEIAKVDGRTGDTVHTDRGDVTAPLIVDALGWRRVLDPRSSVQPPEALLSRGLEVHPAGTADDLELWLDPRYVQAGYGWSFPARDEVRVGVGSFEPRDHVKDPTLRLARDVGVPPEGYQGNWIPHKLRKATDGEVLYVGDSAGHCLPVTAEGIRTALYFGLAAGRELREVVEGRQTKAQAMRRYGAFSDAHAWKFLWLKRTQNLVSRLIGTPAMEAANVAFRSRRLAHWSFAHYLEIAPPRFALEALPPAATAAPVERAAA
jgi:flavin-dependent dehydrogenase